MSREQLKAKIEAKAAELKNRREERLQTTKLLTISREMTDLNKIFEEVDMMLSTSSLASSSDILSTKSPSSLQQKLRPSTNISLQVCRQPSATINIPPKELITYSKIVQTIEPTEQDDTESNDECQQSISEYEFTNSLKQQNKQISLQSQTSSSSSSIKDELTNDERERILQSAQFQDFFSRTSLLIERSLRETQKVDDIVKDYSRKDLDRQKGRMDMKDIIKFDREYFDEDWSHHRLVTCIDTSIYHPELILASYSENSKSSGGSNGVALIWNSKFKSKPTPEYVFNCQSSITSCVFSKFHPNILLGGTYSGQIVVWDTRSNKRTPVQHTFSSILSHTHPVYGLQVIGTQNANNLISVSTEGKMCSWNIEMMTQPQESIDLTYKTKPVAAMRMAFPINEVNHFIIGSEDGQAYFGSRHGNKAGIQSNYEGHFGPVTGLSCHNVNGSIDFSSLFLTSSFDWSVKLWSLEESKSLHSFEVNNDYVTDVHWSPVHPSIFLTCDITGRFDIWNLNYDSELPLLSTTLDRNVALNKCLWSHNGQRIILGDDQGKLHIYDVNESLINSNQDDFNQLKDTLQDFKRNRFDDNRI